MDKRCAYTPTPERGRTAAQHRQAKRDREQDQSSENKENIADQEKDVEIFVLPPPRTPASNKKNARPNKNVLTTPNHNDNVSGSKTNAGTPKGKKRPICYSQITIISVHHMVYLYTVIVFFSQTRTSVTISIGLFALANCPSLQCSFIYLSLSDSCSSHNKCHIHMPHICK